MNWLDIYRQKETRHVIGLMSGTSGDGIDVALVRIHGFGAQADKQLVAFNTCPFPSPLRQRIFDLFDPEKVRINDICGMNFALGQAFTQAVVDLIQQTHFPIEELDAIGSHGQTIWHQPEPEDMAGTSVASTLQIGEASVIAEKLGCPVVSDFRTRDMAAGGQGAPLVPYVDYLLFNDSKKSRAIQNIGGIGNVTYLPAGGASSGVIAFDTGPGNMLIDRFVQMHTQGAQTYDHDGLLAQAGHVSSSLLDFMMENSYFQQPPPKSTGRELFGVHYAQFLWENRGRFQLTNLIDFIATATAFTAESIADSYRRWILTNGSLDEIILGGGGSRNPVLRQMIQDRFLQIPVKCHEDLGLNGDAKEAIAFAILADHTLLGIPSNLPSATGASHSVLLGKITPPLEF